MNMKYILEAANSDISCVLKTTVYIADISIWPWTARFDWQEIDLSEYKNVTRWYKEMADRPAVQKGWLVPQNDQLIPSP